MCEPFGILSFTSWEWCGCTRVLCLEWTLLRLEERGVTSSSEAISKECLLAISKSPRGPLCSASASAMLYMYICDPLWKKGPFGIKYKYKFAVGGQESTLILYHFCNFVTIRKFSLFSLFWYAMFVLYTRISMFNNKKKSDGQLPCRRIQTRSCKMNDR